MAEDSDAQDKTEEPSERKLEKAREDGQIASSKDLFVFTVLTAGLLLLMGFAQLGGGILAPWSDLFQFTLDSGAPGELISQLAEAFWLSLLYATAFGVPLLIVVLLTQFAMDGRINFALKAIEFKGNRINPVSGFQRMFSMKSLVELGKSILKVVFLLGTGFLFFRLFAPELLALQSITTPQSMARIGDFTYVLMGMLLVILLIIAAIDVTWQQYDHHQKLRMSRQELKDEYKQTEGSPEVKAKIRRMQRSVSERASKMRESMENIPDATVVITNPIHFSVALKYRMGDSQAPTIVAMGRGFLALEIKRRATEADVPIIQSPPLARALFFSGDIGAEIDEQLYAAVATIFAFIYNSDQDPFAVLPEVEVPQELNFDEFGMKREAR